jgi:hypothetical protein
MVAVAIHRPCDGRIWRSIGKNEEDVMPEKHGSPKVSGQSKGVKNYSRSQHPCPGTGGDGTVYNTSFDKFMLDSDNPIRRNLPVGLR